ncbi:MAG: transcription antitermination factor NusB [Caulobacteraceae bacterium]|nr:transcription antitermination factor NusB [Caulobacteraceae bacterium]
MKAPKTHKNPAHRARSISRLAAVQALYQMEVSGAGNEAVIREFLDHRFDADIEGETLAPADIDYFSAIVRGAVSRQAEIDRAIVRRLAGGWRLERLDATARAILRAGAFELMSLPEAPTEVVIDEYIEIAKAFFEGPEPGFINGALDGIAQDVRP